MRASVAGVVLTSILAVSCSGSGTDQAVEDKARGDVADWAFEAELAVLDEDGERLQRLCLLLNDAVTEWTTKTSGPDWQESYRTATMTALYSATTSLRMSVCSLSDVFRLPSEQNRLTEEATRFGAVVTCAANLARGPEVDDPDTFTDCAFS